MKKQKKHKKLRLSSNTLRTLNKETSLSVVRGQTCLEPTIIEPECAA